MIGSRSSAARLRPDIYKTADRRNVLVDGFGCGVLFKELLAEGEYVFHRHPVQRYRALRPLDVEEVNEGHHVCAVRDAGCGATAAW